MVPNMHMMISFPILNRCVCNTGKPDESNQPVITTVPFMSA